MDYKFRHLWKTLSLLAVFLTSYSISAPYNGRFELFDYNAVLDINTPTGWQQENYTAVVNHLLPVPGSGQDESMENWLLDPNIGLFPYEGDYFLVLSTEDIEIAYSRVSQTINIEAGQTLMGAYFFGTCDYFGFNDYAEIKLVPADFNINSTINIVDVSLLDVGTFGSMKGWKRFKYTFNVSEIGAYKLTIGVYDHNDLKYKSYFAVDGLVLCSYISDEGDINLDCTTNFEDFALMALEWFVDCNDPNNYNAPYSNCRLDIDLTGDGPVDIDDLHLMAANWLEGIKEE